jgi:hypothetical protein
VCLTQTHTTINKQRVIGFAGVFANLGGRRPGQLIAFTFDKIIENKICVQATNDRIRGSGRPRPGLIGHRCHVNLPGADLNDNLVVAPGAVNDFLDPTQVVLVQPINNEAVWRKQLENSTVLDRL